MAKFNIHGNVYEVDDGIQGDELTSTLNQLVTHSQERNVQKFLTVLGKAEGADYDTLVGGKKFEDFTKHPNTVGLRTAEGPSTAAGRYQITNTTYQEFSRKLGVSGFTPDVQDKIARAIIEQEGAMESIKSGDFQSAVGRLGGRWASLPSSKYSQPKRSAEWMAKELGQAAPVAAPAAAPEAPAAQPVAAPKAGYTPFAPVREDIDPATLNKDPDWVRASKLMYSLRERSSFTGSDDEAAEWGKDHMGYFNSNMVDMARYAKTIATDGTQQDKEAFLYLMDTYDNTNISWAGTKRAAKGMLTDPTNLIGLSTLGLGTAGKVAAAEATKIGVRKLLVQAIGRTGVIAGIEAGAIGAAANSIRQGVEVSAGRKESLSLMELGAATAISGTIGVAVGTAGDLALTKIAQVVKGKRAARAAEKAATAPEVVPATTPAAVPEVPAAVAPGAPTGVVPDAAPVVPAEKKPLRVFHGTKATVEEVADVTGLTKSLDHLGAHYSVERETAEIFANDLGTPGRVLEADLHLDKVLELPDMAGWEAGNVANKLDEMGLTAHKRADEDSLGELGKKVLDANMAAWGTGADAGKAGSEVLKKWLVDQGYDAIKYKNTFEGKPATSYLVLNSSKAKPAKAGAASPELAPNAVLSEAEIAGATGRKQVGRLWVDDLPPVEGANPEAAAKLAMPDRNTGLRSTARSMEELTTDGKAIADQLKGLDDKTMHGVLESFRTGALPLEDTAVIARGVQMHADELRIEQASIIKKLGLSTNANETTALVARLAGVENRLVPLNLADDAFGSMAGSMLRQRQEGLPGVKGVTVDGLMAEKGMTREAAEATYVRLVEGAKQSAEAQKIAADYDARIQQALTQGETAEAAKLTAMKQRELAGVVEREIPGGASFMDKVTEFAISNVFSPTTVAINLIPAAAKTLVLPVAKALVTNPLQRATRVELAATYSAMRSTSGAAWRAAKASFRYEQSLLTRGTGRILEGEMAIEGRKAGVIRFLPRILNATDEFLAQINYNGFVAGRAAADALVEGVKRGIKGTQLDEHVKLASEIAMKEAFKQPDGESLVQPLVNKGVNLGLTGEALQKYVEREAVRDPEALRHGSDEAALDFVKDVLYKRRFSGQGTASGLAVGYESMMNKAPSMKLVLGQLFFRTPIRVFEEGVRLTPGLQILAPNFLTDLAGRNGHLPQVRAQAEAMTSLAITGAVLSLYSSGRITGDGAYANWKQQRTATDGPGPQPYTIQMSDGSTWSYRNFDPVATPFKIIVNGLERMDKLAIRQAQGEFVSKTAWDQAQAYVTVGTSAIAAALRDANLVAGIDQSIKFFENMADPEGKEDAWLKLMGEKLSLLVPNTFHKLAKQNDPTIKDPADFWQVVESRLHINAQDDVKTSYSYDVLGSVRQMADTGTLWNIFSQATPEERTRGHSQEWQGVMLELDRLQKETGAVFAPPLKHPMTGGLDLRTILTADKSETLYDRWQRNYRELQPEVILYPIVMAEMPDGTFKHKAMRVETVQSVMKELRNAAFMKLVADEEKVLDEVINQEIGKAKASAGLLDFSVRDK